MRQAGRRTSDLIAGARTFRWSILSGHSPASAGVSRRRATSDDARSRSPARIVSRSPAAGGEPPHLFIIYAVVSGRSQQPFRLRLRPSVSDPLLVHEQLPRHQARTRAAGLVEVRGHLKHLLHSNLIHLWPRASVRPPGLPRLASQSNPARCACTRWPPRFGPLARREPCLLPSPTFPGAPGQLQRSLGLTVPPLRA